MASQEKMKKVKKVQTKSSSKKGTASTGPHKPARLIAQYKNTVKLFTIKLI